MAEMKNRRPGGPGGPGGSHLPAQKPKNLKGTLLRIYGYLSGNKGLLVLLVLMLLINTGSAITGTYFLRPLLNNYILPGDFTGLALSLLVLSAIYLAGVVASRIMMSTNIQIAHKTVNRIRGEMFSKMQNLPLKYFDAHTHGELMSRFTSDAENVMTMLEQSLTQVISSALMFVGIVCVMLYMSPLLFIVTAFVIACMVVVVAVMGKRSQKYFSKQQAILGNLNGNIEETIGGLREVKAFNHEKVAVETFSVLNTSYRNTAKKANFIAGAMMPIMFNLNNISYALTAVLGGTLTVFSMFDLGALASYLQYSRQIGQPINQISGQLNNLYAAIAGAERIFALMDETPEIDDGSVTLEKISGKNGKDAWEWVKPDGARVPLQGDVRFNDITFSYDGEKTVLKNVSLYAKPGQTIAFVGSTGAGKTTITNLVNRFYDVQSGSLTYDGIDVREIKKDSLRRSLGMVLQDTHLFTGTVMENLRYGKLEATDEECMEAATKAGAHSFISRLPNGYQTVLDGDGSNFSQGQRQLLAIARTYIAQPPVMILDEATSSIDTRTERQLQKGMDLLMEGRTVFVIAHRLSTIQGAKAIIVLENGEIIERGTHEELLAMEGRYYQLQTGVTQLS